MTDVFKIAAGIALGYVGIILFNAFVLVPFALYLAR